MPIRMDPEAAIQKENLPDRALISHFHCNPEPNNNDQIRQEHDDLDYMSGSPYQMALT